MKKSDKYLLNLIEHIDLPGHDGVVDIVKRMLSWPPYIYSISAGVIVFAILSYARVDVSLAASIAIAFSTVGILQSFIGESISGLTNRFANGSAICFALAGFFGAILFGLHGGRAWTEVALYATGFAIGGGVVGFLVIVGLGFVYALLFRFMIFISLPLAWPILKIMAFSENLRMRIEYKGWKTPDGKQVIVFGAGRVAKNNGFHNPIFVAHPSLRQNGRAAENGLPKFTYKELRNSALVESKMTDAVHAINSGEMASGSSKSFTQPGWSVIGESAIAKGYHPGSDDVFVAINPASGLPTVAGAGSPDVAGKSWGTVNQQF